MVCLFTWMTFFFLFFFFFFFLFKSIQLDLDERWTMAEQLWRRRRIDHRTDRSIARLERRFIDLFVASQSQSQSRCKQSDSVARTAACRVASVFDTYVRLQVKRAHDVPLIRNLTNSSEQPSSSRFDSARAHTNAVSAAITIRLGDNLIKFSFENGVCIGSSMSRAPHLVLDLLFKRVSGTVSANGLFDRVSRQCFNYRTWEPVIWRLCAKPRQVTKTVCGPRNRTNLTEPRRNYFGTSSDYLNQCQYSSDSCVQSVQALSRQFPLPSSFVHCRWKLISSLERCCCSKQ